MDLLDFLPELPEHLVEDILLNFPPNEYIKLSKLSSIVTPLEKLDLIFLKKYEQKYIQTKREKNSFRHGVETQYLGPYKHGMETTFHTFSGKPFIFTMFPYKFGKRDGEGIVYWKNSKQRRLQGLQGVIKSISHHKNGKLDGEQFSFYDPTPERLEEGLSGSPEFYRKYHNGKLEIFIEYDKPTPEQASSGLPGPVFKMETHDITKKSKISKLENK